MRNNKIKIALVLPRMAEGGLETSVLRISSFLKKNGYEVTVITTEQSGLWFNKIKEHSLSGKHIAGLKKWFPYSHAYRVGKALRDDDYDVIFTVFDRFSQAALSMLSDKVIVIPLLRNDHEDVYRIGLANKDKWNIAIGNSPKIHEIAKQRVPDHPIGVIANGVSIPETWRPKVEADWEQPLKIAFVGRLIHESKGILLLPEIIKRCCDKGLKFTLTIAGDGVDKEKLIHKSTELGVIDKIRLTGMVSHSEVKELLLSSHILLFPSYYEGLPNVIIEAQACGCIPVASRLPGITDFLIKDGVTGLLVERGDAEGFAEAIAKLSRNPSVSTQMCKAAHQYMSENFSEEVEGNKYKELINEALNGVYPLPKPRKAIIPINLKLFSWRYIFGSYLRKSTYWLLKNILYSIKTTLLLPYFIKLFIKEYIANSVIPKIPSISLRSWFYRKIMEISMDKTVNIQMGCYIYNSNGDFKIGSNSVVNRGCILDRRGSLYIGSCVNISSEVAIYTAGHDPNSSAFSDYLKPVEIEDHVWIGTRAMIMPGVTIRKGAVVLPGAIVTKDVEPFKIVGGIPAKVVSERNNNLNYNPAWYPLFQ